MTVRVTDTTAYTLTARNPEREASHRVEVTALEDIF